MTPDWADPDAIPALELTLDHGAGHPHLVVTRDAAGRIAHVHSRWATREQALRVLAVAA